VYVLQYGHIGSWKRHSFDPLVPPHTTKVTYTLPKQKECDKCKKKLYE
jgi:hypothetical protein